GFTLVEVLTVIAIISILAGVVYASLGEARKEARDTARYNDIRQIELAVEAFGSAYDRYPSAADGNCRHDESFGPGGCLQVLVDTGFFSELPIDPLDESYNSDPHEAHMYFYDNWCRAPGPGSNSNKYRLWANGERNNDADPKWWNEETIGVTPCEDPS
ncbi:MAG: type II secretion system protein, partial [Candidatus Paceibacterota bacterium]